MAVAVSTKGVKNLVKEINDAYGKHIVTAESDRHGFTILVGENPAKPIYAINEVVYYLEGVKHGIELMKEGLQLLIGQCNGCP